MKFGGLVFAAVLVVAVVAGEAQKPCDKHIEDAVARVEEQNTGVAQGYGGNPGISATIFEPLAKKKLRIRPKAMKMTKRMRKNGVVLVVQARGTGRVAVGALADAVQARGTGRVAVGALADAVQARGTGHAAARGKWTALSRFRWQRI